MARERSVDVLVGIFVLVCLALGAGMIMKFGKYSPRGQERYEFSVTFSNAGGLIRDANVMYAGIPVGKVREINLVEGDQLRVKITLAINQGVVIRQTARFVINQAGLLGDRYVDVVPGSTSAPAIRPGDEMSGETSVDLSEAIRGVVEVLRQAAGTIARIDKAIQRIDESVLSQQSLDHLTSTMAQVDQTTSNSVALTQSLRQVVEDNRGQVDETLGNLRDASTALHAASRRAEELLAHADGLITTNQDDLRAAVENVAESAERLGVILGRLEKGEGTLGKLLVDPTLHDEVLKLVQNLREHGLLYKESGRRPRRIDDEPRRGMAPVPARPAQKATD